MPSCLLSACYVLYTDLGAVATEKTKQKKKKNLLLWSLPFVRKNR